MKIHNINNILEKLYSINSCHTWYSVSTFTKKWYRGPTIIYKCRICKSEITRCWSTYMFPISKLEIHGLNHLKNHKLSAFV